jgi:prepilin-type N-terminal cleavage/methylation domain-containing protein
MIDRLRSHLRSEKGFTLIELLVVIAIIAVLVVIVVIAINPIEQINKGRDRAAASDVRSTGSLVSACITEHLASNASGWSAACTPETAAALLAQGTPAVDVEVDSAAAADTDACAWKEGRAGTFWVYRHTTGQVTDQGTAPAACI